MSEYPAKNITAMPTSMDDTYLRFTGSPKLLYGKNAASSKEDSIRFFTRDWACVRCMASPKQPQSMEGFSIHRSNVSIVNPAIRMVDAHAVAFLKIPVMRKIPMNVSVNANSSPMTPAKPRRNPI